MGEITTTNYAGYQEQELRKIVDSAFSTGLAATIMSQFPFVSIVAIFMGKKATSLVDEADRYAAQAGLKAGGKRMAAKVLGKFGFISGIVCSALYVFYFFYFILIFALAFIG